jgi:hypothetical protein
MWARKDVADKEKVAILSLLLSFIVRRAVCGLTPKKLQQVFSYTHTLKVPAGVQPPLPIS